MDLLNFIKDNKTYNLSKDKNNNNVTNHQIHDIVFIILLEIDRICRKNNIPYALSFGTAMGLNNYGTFIPWDDDADVTMKYEDYLRFVDVLQTDLSDKFTFECYEVDNRANVLIPAMKVRYKDSNIVERNHFFLPNRTKRGNGLFVDVAPFINVPSNPKEHKRLLWKAKFYLPIYVFLDAFLHINPKCIKKRLKKYEEKINKKYENSGYVSQSVIIPFQELPLKIVENNIFPKEVIYPFKEYLFNGVPFYSFNDVEKFIELRYGTKSLKIWDGDKYLPPFKAPKKSGHLLRVDIGLDK